MARTVRISRAPAAADAAGIGFRRNSFALTRALRLYLLYLVALVAIYGAFVADLAASRAGFAGNPTSAPLFITLLAIASALWGYFLTLARTPRGVELREHAFVLVEFTGRRREYDLRRALDVRVENRYPAGWLAPGPTELVRLNVPGRPSRLYLLSLGLLPERSAPGGAVSLQ